MRRGLAAESPTAAERRRPHPKPKQRVIGHPAPLSDQVTILSSEYFPCPIARSGLTEKGGEHRFALARVVIYGVLRKDRHRARAKLISGRVFMSAQKFLAGLRPDKSFQDLILTLQLY